MTRAVVVEQKPVDRMEQLAALWSTENADSFDIFTAACLNNGEAVQEEISRGVDINKLNRSTWTCLMYAAYYGHVTTCNILLEESNIRMDAQNSRGQTALMLAASSGSDAVVKLLLRNRATVDIVDENGQSALHYAVSYNYINVVKLLIQFGANPNLPTRNTGMTPLHFAFGYGLSTVANYLLEKGADHNLKTLKGRTARTLAYIHGHQDILQLLDRPMSNSTIGNLTDGSSLTVPKPTRKSSSPSSFNYGQNKSPNGDQSQNDHEKTMTDTRPKSLADFLAQLDLSKYESVFEEQEVTLSMLSTLNDDDLKEIGIRTYGTRKKILDAISRKWNNKTALPARS